jgi:hypothetical protein
MCLWTIYTGKRKKKILAELPDEVVCWKVVRRRRNGEHYFSEYNYNPRSRNFLNGWNTTKPLRLGEGYLIAFHAFLTREGAEHWDFWGKLHIVRCKTKKTDIVAIGSQKNRQCLVTQRIWIPKPRKSSHKNS